MVLRADVVAKAEQIADAFTADYTRKIDAYKDKRYSGLLGKGRWVKDQFAGLPSEVNASSRS